MAQRRANGIFDSGQAAGVTTRFGVAVVAGLGLLLAASPALALEENVYRQFLGIDSRRLVWFLAQMHLFFGAFVLGVPLFAVIIEIVGWKNDDAKFDKLAYEFTSLLSVAYATTAALGGLLAFALFTLYPTFMGYMAGIFKDVMFMYALLFFGETFALYLYYYGWKWLKTGRQFPAQLQWVFKGLSLLVAVFGLAYVTGLIGPEMRTDMRWFTFILYIVPVAAGLWIIRGRKTTHIFIGILLNVFGTGIMQLANSWAGFMMSPVGVDADGVFVGTVWQAFENVLATPIAIHRMLGNLAFGGLVAGSYAAVKFISAKTAEER
ncbi:MAG: cytochrome ubiquinol oxidase subunit I, partial [Paracoccaceae bacterium]